MKNITYLLGAGASARALPTNRFNPETKTLSHSFIEVANILSQQMISKDVNLRSLIFPECHGICDIQITNLRWLSEESEKLGTVDTFAKYLYDLGNKRDLLKLKSTLSFYFTYTQLLSNRIDPRARIFITKVMEKGPHFPTRVKIISWNYDFQIQIAANKSKKEYCAGNNTHKSLIQYPPALFYGPEMDSSESYSLVHMNGIAGHFYSPDSKKLNPLINETITDINSLLLWYLKESNNDHIMTFAFEKDEKDKDDVMGIGIHNDSMRIAKSIAESTDILVIIGYSFPHDNWVYDKKIIDVMKNSRLEKIYIQDPAEKNEDLIDRFNINEIREIEILYKKDCDNYYIPSELYNT